MKRKLLLPLFLFAWLPVGLHLAGSFKNGGVSLTEALVLLSGTAAIAALNWRYRKNGTLSSAFFVFIAFFILYLAALLFMPPLGAAVFGALSFGAFGLSFLPEKAARKYAGLMPLLVGGLPIAASAQFLIGYPLQRLTALLSAFILSPLNVSASGTGLAFPGGVVMVDPSCSGLMGFTVISIASMLFAVLFAPGFVRLIACGISGILAAIFYNTLRACWLFLYHFFFGPPSAFIHSLAGLVALLLALVLLMLWIQHAVKKLPDFPEFAPIPLKPPVFVFLLTAALLSVFVPRVPLKGAETASVQAKPGEFGAVFTTNGLISIPFDEREARFYEKFPGRAGKYRGGERVFLIRQIEKPSRYLHSVAECYRATGCDARELTPEKRDIPGLDAGLRFSRFSVTEQGKTFEVLEAILSANGTAYETASEWYWKTAFGGKDRGPWLVVSVKE